MTVARYNTQNSRVAAANALYSCSGRMHGGCTIQHTSAKAGEVMITVHHFGGHHVSSIMHAYGRVGVPSPTHTYIIIIIIIII